MCPLARLEDMQTARHAGHEQGQSALPLFRRERCALRQGRSAGTAGRTATLEGITEPRRKSGLKIEDVSEPAIDRPPRFRSDATQPEPYKAPIKGSYLIESDLGGDLQTGRW